MDYELTKDAMQALIGCSLGAFIIGGFLGWMIGFGQGKDRNESSEEWDDLDEYLDYLPIVKVLLKDTKPSEVFEPDPEIARLRKETQRMALTFKKRLLRRLLKKGPDPDAENDKT